jgi:hypothetical protein
VDFFFFWQSFPRGIITSKEMTPGSPVFEERRCTVHSSVDLNLVLEFSSSKKVPFCWVALAWEKKLQNL